MHAVAKAQLLKHVPDVGLHRRFGDGQGPGDLGVGQPVADQDEDLALPGGEGAEIACSPVAQSRQPGEPIKQPPGNRGGEHRVSCGDGADRADQRIGRVVLDQEAAGARPESVKYVTVDVKRGEDEDAGARGGGDDLACRLDAVESWHADVHDDHVRIEPADAGDRSIAVGRFSGNREVRFCFQDVTQAGTHHRLIVNDKDADHAVLRRLAGREYLSSPTGSVARTRKPEPGTGAASNRPPSSAARSFIPIRPCPGSGEP